MPIWLIPIIIAIAASGGTAGATYGVVKFVNRTSIDDLIINDKQISVNGAVEHYEKVLKQAVKKDKIT